MNRLKTNERSYTKLKRKTNMTIEPIRLKDKVIFKIQDTWELDSLIVNIHFYADRLGRAVSPIENSYFDFPDDKEVYNAMGAVQYKVFLLERIKNSLQKKRNQPDDTEGEKVTR